MLSHEDAITMEDCFAFFLFSLGRLETHGVTAPPFFCSATLMAIGIANSELKP